MHFSNSSKILHRLRQWKSWSCHDPLLVCCSYLFVGPSSYIDRHALQWSCPWEILERKLFYIWKWLVCMRFVTVCVESDSPQPWVQQIQSSKLGSYHSYHGSYTSPSWISVEFPERWISDVFWPCSSGTIFESAGIQLFAACSQNSTRIFYIFLFVATRSRLPQLPSAIDWPRRMCPRPCHPTVLFEVKSHRAATSTADTPGFLGICWRWLKSVAKHYVPTLKPKMDDVSTRWPSYQLLDVSFYWRWICVARWRLHAEDVNVDPPSFAHPILPNHLKDPQGFA